MNGYVAAGYGVTFMVLAAYSLRVVLRARALRRTLGETADRPPAGRP